MPRGSVAIAGLRFGIGMFVSDAHLYVPREIRWKRVMAIRFSAMRRRKSLWRRLKRDMRAALPLAALALTFSALVVTAELAVIVVPNGATQSPGAQAVQQTAARLFAPPEPEKPVVGRVADSSRPAPLVPRVPGRASVAMLD